MSSTPDYLKEGQILCLEYQSTILFAELIQLQTGGSFCWVRPIAIAISTVAATGQFNVSSLDPNSPQQAFALQGGVDLLWPISLFRPALDVELMTILTDINQNKPSNTDLALANQRLKNFVEQVWQAFPEEFQNSRIYKPD